MYSTRFLNATDKLINAFLMEKLEHGRECSCAVGALCGGNRDWFGYGWDKLSWSTERAVNAMKHTGYSPFEIFEIEKHFEGRTRSFLVHRHDNCSPVAMPTLNSLNDADGFIGLCHVFDYLISLEDYENQGEQIKLTDLISTREYSLT